MPTMLPSPQGTTSDLSIEISPHIDAAAICSACGTAVEAHDILWQGIHICAKYRCPLCNQEFLEDLPVGQAIFTPYRVSKEGELLGDGESSARIWFGTPLRDSLQKPSSDIAVEIGIEILRPAKDVVILNCIDYLYGHCLLKLLNADVHYRRGERDLVVIVPAFLRWMVPSYVAEVWTLDIPLHRARSYFPAVHERVSRELRRFERVRVSLARSHPPEFDITAFTGVRRHKFQRNEYRLTFIWRSDRLWLEDNNVAVRILRRAGLSKLLLQYQRWKVCALFGELKGEFPAARFTVAGLGRHFRFPSWIDDVRVNDFDGESEIRSCQIYSESRVVFGVHGSSMLLPSAHAGMVIDLMPSERWSNMAQDVLYHQGDFNGDHRVASFRARYIPIESSARTLAGIIRSMIRSFPEVVRAFC